MQEDDAPTSKQCIACAAEIPAEATLCRNCSSYQSDWKNRLKFFANTFGVAGVIVAVTAYTISVIPEMRRVVAWNESLSVISYDNQTYTISNEGDGELFLSHFFFRYSMNRKSDQTATYLEPIGRVIESSEILTGQSAHWRPSDEAKTVVSGVSDEEWVKLYEASEPVLYEPCIVRRFVAQDDRILKMWQQVLKQNLKTFYVEAHLHYYSPRTHSMEMVPFDVVGVLQAPKSGRCEE